MYVFCSPVCHLNKIFLLINVDINTEGERGKKEPYFLPSHTLLGNRWKGMVKVASFITHGLQLLLALHSQAPTRLKGDTGDAVDRGACPAPERCLCALVKQHKEGFQWSCWVLWLL